MAEELEDWLTGLGLGQYARTFADNGIDLETLPHLRDEDFERLGVLLGHMRKLQSAIETLSSAASPASSASATGRNSDSQPIVERRQLTVMFCDLVGSTALSTALDPEDMREMLRAYQETCSEVVRRYDGFVAKYMGDGVLVYFGYPQAHEDDAERAVYTALEIVEAVKGLVHGPSVRIGIATGMVVVGDIVGEGASQEAAITGETPNLAARLQELANPNCIVIAPTTRSLVSGLFDLEDLGTHSLKGFERDVRAWTVKGAHRTESRFDATRSGHLTALIGRDEEMEILLRRWDLAKAGKGQVVLISGEPGIGKSRLLRELEEVIGRRPHHRLSHQCSPYHSNSALYPVIERLERTAGLQAADAPETKLTKLETLIEASGGHAPDKISLLASLLSIPTGNRYPSADVSPLRRKELTFQAIIDQLIEISEQRPLLFSLEDAQWVDPTTAELLEHMVPCVTNCSILVLVTHRPEFDSPWRGHPRVTPIALRRLETHDCLKLIDMIAGTKVLPDALRERISAQTDGVPLFAEELSKSVLETAEISECAPATMEVPLTLRDSLMARLDRLGPAKEVAQVGASIGRQFTYRLLAAVVPLEEDALREALDRLAGAELLFVLGTPPEATYSFKHALLQEVAYESQLRRRRQELHQKIATALQEKYPEIVNAEPEFLAHHATRANLTEIAIASWHRAGVRAYERSAIREAVSHFNQALALLPSLPDKADAARQELKLQIALGRALKDLRSFGHPDVSRVFGRARELCQEIGETAELFPALLGMSIFYVTRAELQLAFELGDQLLEFAENAKDPVLLVEAHYALGVVHFPSGDFLNARKHLEWAVALYDEREHPAHVALYGQDAGAVCLSRLALTLWYLGYPEQALEKGREAIALAERVRHPFTRAYVQHWVTMLYKECGLVEETDRRASEFVGFSAEQGFAFWPALGRVIQGWAKCERDQMDAGLALMRQGLEEQDALGAELGKPYFLGVLAEAQGKSGGAREGLATIERALTKIEEKGQRWPESELHRIKGELLQRLDREGAEESFLRALRIARDQSAKSAELRAALALASFRRGQGRTEEARGVLAPAYDWFTEGHDTADIGNARALLEELA